MHTRLKAMGTIIAEWKIESDEECQLAQKADISFLERKEYCDFYRKKDREYYDKGVLMAKDVINRHEGYKLGIAEEDLIVDMIYCLHRFGFTYDEYFWFKLYNISTYGREGFISDKMRYEYYLDLNTDEGLKLLRDKWRTYERLKDFYKRDCCAVYSSEDERKFSEFTKKHKQFFYKPLSSDSAKNCQKMDSSDVAFGTLISKGPFIVEELIQQCGDFADFYPDAVNILRIPVLTTKDDEIHLMGPFLTFGQNDMRAVNAGAGGIIASIDPDTGVVLGNGWVEKSETEYPYHPETHKRIIGYQIPDWEQAVALCKKASKLIPECKYIGFDLAQTKDGWIIIEANSFAQFLGQRNTEGLKRQMLAYLENI